MIASRYTQYIEKFLPPLLGKLQEKYNDKETEQPFLHKQFLREEYSPTLNWGSSSLSHAIVAADVVSLNSSLPLKSRGKISTASGEIPKLGVKYQKDEKFIQDLELMKASGRANDAAIAAKVMEDTPLAIKAIETRKEMMFLQALSTGVLLAADGSATDADNQGVGVRADFGYLEENKFKATKAAWGTATATPLDDLRQLFTKADADSNAITHLFISKKYFNHFRASEQGKILVASFLGQTIVDKTLLPTPSTSTFKEAVEDELGCRLVIVQSSHKVQMADGSTKAVNPWEEGNIVGVTQEQVGRLVHSTLAEETNPVAGVSYAKVGHVLVSKYGQNDPLREFTTAQALCLPVIDGGQSVYLLDATKK